MNILLESPEQPGGPAPSLSLDTQRVGLLAVIDHSSPKNRKDHRLFRLAPTQPVTMETEIPLAVKQQPVAMGTWKTSIPGDQ